MTAGQTDAIQKPREPSITASILYNSGRETLELIWYVVWGLVMLGLDGRVLLFTGQGHGYLPNGVWILPVSGM